jgi:hypothetical protein
MAAAPCAVVAGAAAPPASGPFVSALLYSVPATDRFLKIRLFFGVSFGFFRYDYQPVQLSSRCDWSVSARVGTINPRSRTMKLQMSGAGPCVGKPPAVSAMHSFSRRDIVRGFAVLAALSAFAADSLPVAAAEVPLAIKGYDPVAYFTDGKPTQGLPDIEYGWDEHRYRFVSAEHRELFKADPVHYAPQFGNFCAMALSKGEIVVADPENWLISDGKLYVFGKKMGPTLFQQDLAANITKANQNRPILPKD